MIRRVTELIGMRVISRTTGSDLAVVRDLVFTPVEHRIAALLVDRGGWFRDELAVPWSAVSGIGDVVLVEGEDPLIAVADDLQLVDLIASGVPMTRTAVIDAAGYRLGTADDIVISESGEVLGFEVGRGFLNLADGKFLPLSQVCTIGWDAIIAETSQLLPLEDLEQEQQSLAEPTLEMPQPRKARVAGSELLGEAEGAGPAPPSPAH